MKTPIIYNRLESIKSTVGTDGYLTAAGTPEYSTVMFGNGFRNITAYEGIEFSTSMSLGVGVIEFWVKMGNYTPAAHPATSLLGTNGTSLIYPTISLGYYNSWGSFLFQIVSSSGVNAYIAVTAAVAGFTSAEQIMHIALVWDATQGTGAIASATDYMKLYIDGVEMTTFYGTGVAGGITYEICQAATTTQPFCVGATRLWGWSCYPYIDNMKYYNYLKTDFSDRFYERSGLNDQVINV